MKAKKEFITKINRITRDQRLDPNKLGLFALLFMWLNTDEPEDKQFIRNLITAQYIIKGGIRTVEDRNLVPGPTNTVLENGVSRELRTVLDELGFGEKSSDDDSGV